MFYYLSNKIASQHRQLMVLTKENSKLKNKLSKGTNISINSLVVKYKTPPFNKAIVVKKCTLHISPLENSSMLSNMDIDTKLEVLDSAEVLGLTWYEVSIPLNDKKNSKGWIRASSVNILTDEQI